MKYIGIGRGEVYHFKKRAGVFEVLLNMHKFKEKSEFFKVKKAIPEQPLKGSVLILPCNKACLKFMFKRFCLILM